MHQNLTERRSVLLTAFEVVQTILSFGGFTVALIGLCYKIFKDEDKKITRPHFCASRTD
ncbi:TPA: putative holin-like toxin [Streptococcus suis]|nr:putative holin-like toxin [Streptococcus suis]